MTKLGFSRPVTWLLLSVAGLVLVAALALAAFLITSRSVFSTRGPLLDTPVRWTGLPVPVVTNPQWTTYSFAGPINDIALAGDLLWAATEGGLVAWNLADQTDLPVKWMTEHGLAANRTTSLAVGQDGVIWVGTVGGLNRYDGRAWQTFTVEDGLPNDEIVDLVTDRQGYVWAATTEGLARYDGREWRAISDRGLLPSLPKGRVNALAVDPANRLWVGTDQGLVRYDGRWKIFTAADGLSNEPVRRIIVGPTGEIWMTTPSGFKRFNGQSWDTFTPVLPGDDAPVLESLVFVQDADGTLLISPATEPPTLLRFDPASSETRVETEFWPDEKLPSSVTSMLVDAGGIIWAGVDNGVHRLVSGLPVILVAPSELPSPEVNSLLYAQGNVWLATGQGVSRYAGTWQTYGIEDGLIDTVATELAVDRSGDIWTASLTPLNGLSRFDAATGRWNTIACPVDAPYGVFIQQVVKGLDGTLWFATEWGVSRFDGRGWRAYSAQEGLPPGSVDALVVTRDGMVWAGTGAGLALLSGDQWRVIDPLPVNGLAAAGEVVWVLGEGRLYQASVDGLEPVPDPPLSAPIRGLAATPDGAWLATADGVFKFDGSSWSIFTTTAGLPSLDVTAIAADGDDIWAATSDNEQQTDLVLFDGQAWQPHPNRDVAAEQLLSSVVRDIQRTPDGDMWLATPAGINRFHDDRWTSFTTDDGLPGVDVRALAWTYETLWAATDLGLARYNGRGWEVFGAAAHDQPGAGIHSMAVGPDGKLWIALDEGWPNALRVFDGRGWSVVPTRSDSTSIHQMAVDPSGRLLALVTDFGRSYLGVFDGQNWVWQDEVQWPLAIDRMAVDKLGRLWITGRQPATGMANPQIAVYDVTPDGIGKELARFTDSELAEFENGDILSGGNPILMAEDRHRVFLGGSGVVFEFDADQIGDLQPTAAIDIDLPFSRHTFDLELDGAGRLWVGSERGVAILDTDSEPSAGRQVASYYAPARTPAWWGSVRSITIRPDGGILLGTAAGGIGIYTGRDFDGVLHPSQGPRSWARSFFPINAVLSDDVGRLWVGSAGGGAARFSGSSWEVVAPDPALLSPVTGLGLTDGGGWLGTEAGLVAVSGLTEAECHIERIEPGLEVTAVLPDESGGLWAGTAGNGAARLDKGLDDAIRLELGKAPVPALAVAPNGEMWFANGHQPWLTRYRPSAAPDDENAWTRLPLNLGQISPASIMALAIAPNLDIWIGSGQGLVRFSGGDWEQMTTEVGLADDQIHDLLITPGGEVWVSTPGGLSRFSP